MKHPSPLDLLRPVWGVVQVDKIVLGRQMVQLRLAYCTLQYNTNTQ